jgi:hypothetical protein
MIDLVIRRMIFQISNNPNPASSRGVTVLNLLEVLVRPVDPLEEPGFRNRCRRIITWWLSPRSAKPYGMWLRWLINGLRF